MSFYIGRELTERQALFTPARGFRNLEKLNDAAAETTGKFNQTLFLILKAESFFLLTSRGNTCPGDELLVHIIISATADPRAC